MPTETAMRRALHRAETGVSLDPAEAEVLLAARGADLDRLATAAGRVRDAGLLAAGRPGVVTYSPKVFIPLTRLCRDRCHYCTFATVPAPAARAPYLVRGRGAGDRPRGRRGRAARRRCSPSATGRRSAGRRPRSGWTSAATSSTLDYLRAMAIAVLEETGLLPHLNPGVLSWEELQRLKPVAPSMGMMLETTSQRLWSRARRAALRLAGQGARGPAASARGRRRGAVPFTTGILVGIGETLTRAGRLAVRDAPDRPRLRRHPGSDRAELPGQARHRDARTPRDLPLDEYLRHGRGGPAGARARHAHPGAAEPVRAGSSSPGCWRAGIDDWGGVSPVTPDHVNPERPWPHARRADGADRGGRVRAAAPADRPSGVRAAGRAVARPADLRRTYAALADPETGLAAGRQPASRAALAGDRRRRAGGGRPRDLHVEIDTAGRHADRRTDFADVYGDWDAARELVSDQSVFDAGPAIRRRGRHSGGPAAARSAPAVLDSGELASALRRAADDPAGLTDAEALGTVRRGRAGRWTRSAGWPTSCAGRRSATRSPTW